MNNLKLKFNHELENVFEACNCKYPEDFIEELDDLLKETLEGEYKTSEIIEKIIEYIDIREKEKGDIITFFTIFGIMFLIEQYALYDMLIKKDASKIRKIIGGLH